MLLELRGSLIVGIVDLLKQSLTQEVVLDLLLAVQVHCMVVRRELVSLKELDRSLVQLDDDYLVQESQALDVALSLDD